tara:strand:+ start:1229 stop:2740 length:1512 start_codon:yes stop_codon:yes gene_type:complete
MKNGILIILLNISISCFVQAASYRVGHDDSNSPWSSGKVLITSVQGEIDLTNNATRSKLLKIDVEVGKFISPNHTVRTGRYSEIGLLFANGATILITANSEVSLDKYILEEFDGNNQQVISQIQEPSSSKTRLNLHYGELFYKSISLNQDSEFEIETPLGAAGIRGTEFKIAAAGNSVSILLAEGKLDFMDNYQQRIIVPQNKVWTLRQESKESWPKVEIIPAEIQQIKDLKQVNILNQQSAYGVQLDEFTAAKIEKTIQAPKVQKMTQAVPTQAGDLNLARIPVGYITPDITRPNFKVKITYDFSLGQFEVTQGQYEKIMGENPSVNRGSANLPVDTVTWEEAVEFCKRLTEAEHAAGRLSKDYIYRLPSESEWEYASRAGTDNLYFFGPESTDLGLYAWMATNGENQSHAVGKKSANPYGLHDIYGNVFEWCHDWYADYPNQAVDNYSGPANGEAKVLRGGYYGSQTTEIGSGIRGGHKPTVKSPAIGFRVCLAPASSIPQ